MSPIRFIRKKQFYKLLSKMTQKFDEFILVCQNSTILLEIISKLKIASKLNYLTNISKIVNS